MHEQDGTAHPRMRGEGAGLGARLDILQGSSPHARGGLRQPRAGHAVHRLIPACAGRAPRILGRSPAAPAHPRMRGEGQPGGRLMAGGAGSSPHARGGRRTGRSRSASCRLIPACAGRANAGPSGLGWMRAHPRMRGEGLVEVVAVLGHAGSSPHARGGHKGPDAPISMDRLIPACAGRASRS